MVMGTQAMESMALGLMLQRMSHLAFGVITESLSVELIKKHYCLVKLGGPIGLMS